jgi:hypothetical protein
VVTGKLHTTFLEDFMTYQIVSERKAKHQAKIKNPLEVYELVKRYAALKQEYFILLTLNGATT